MSPVDALRQAQGPELIETAQAWHDQDPDEATRAELATLILAAKTGDAQGVVELGRRFAARLEFGTAGLRGELGAGSNRMNRVLVAQAAAGFAAYLLEKHTAAGAPSVSDQARQAADHLQDTGTHRI